jgi:hypothetical protein
MPTNRPPAELREWCDPEHIYKRLIMILCCAKARPRVRNWLLIGGGIVLLAVFGLGLLLPAIGRWHEGRELALRRARQGYLNLQPPSNCGKWGFIDKSGRFVIEAAYGRASVFSEGLAAVSIGGKYGYIDKRGRVVIKPRFDLAGRFFNGVAVVNVGAKVAGMGFLQGGVWFCIDRSGNRLPKAFSEDSRLPSEGITPVKQGEKWGYMDADGKWIIPPSFEWADAFSNGLAPVRLSGARGQCGMINARGEFVIPPHFESLSNFAEGLAAASRDGAFGFINRQGQWIIPPEFANVRDFSGGLATYAAGKFYELWGVLDRTGKLLTPPRYPQSWGFSEGLAATMISEALPNEGQRQVLWGFIDSTGEFAIPPDFAWADSFSEGLAAVEVADPNVVHPLTRAIYMGRKEQIQEALARVTNINHLPELETPPLALAVIIGRAEAVKLLLAAGADVNWKYEDHTLLGLARERGDNEISQMLEAAMAKKPVARPSPGMVQSGAAP